MLKLLFLCLALVGGNALAKSPNVVVILTDDQGWGDLSLHGNTNLSTPNIDKLGARRRTDRTHKKAIKASPLRSEPVQVRRAEILIAATAQIPPPLVISQDDDDIRLASSASIRETDDRNEPDEK